MLNHTLVATGADAGIITETVHRFKGLESDVVIFVAADYTPGRDAALVYIGLSRARAHLEVIGPPELIRAPSRPRRSV